MHLKNLHHIPHENGLLVQKMNYVRALKTPLNIEHVWQRAAVRGVIFSFFVKKGRFHAGCDADFYDASGRTGLEEVGVFY